MRSLFKKIVAVFSYWLNSVRNCGELPQVHKIARGNDPGPANFFKSIY